MAKYAIKVEQINEDGTREAFAMGDGSAEIPCEGYVLLGITDDDKAQHTTAALYNVNMQQIVEALRGCKQLAAAARLASIQSMVAKMFGEERDANQACQEGCGLQPAAARCHPSASGHPLCGGANKKGSR